MSNCRPWWCFLEILQPWSWSCSMNLNIAWRNWSCVWPCLSTICWEPFYHLMWKQWDIKCNEDLKETFGFACAQYNFFGFMPLLRGFRLTIWYSSPIIIEISLERKPLSTLVDSSRFNIFQTKGISKCRNHLTYSGLLPVQWRKKSGFDLIIRNFHQDSIALIFLESKYP